MGMSVTTLVSAPSGHFVLNNQNIIKLFQQYHSSGDNEGVNGKSSVCEAPTGQALPTYLPITNDIGFTHHTKEGDIFVHGWCPTLL